jgi:hypothetical protein
MSSIQEIVKVSGFYPSLKLQGKKASPAFYHKFSGSKFFDTSSAMRQILEGGGLPILPFYLHHNALRPA